MTILIETRDMNVPAEDVWKVLKNFAGFDQNSPSVNKVEMLSTNEQGLGAQRKCTMYDNRSVIETVVDWEEGKSLTLKIEGPPLKDIKTELKVVPVNESSSQMIWTTSYEPKMWLLGKMMDKLVIQKKFKGVMQNEMAGINEHALTGEKIDNKWTPGQSLVQVAERAGA